MQDVKDEETDPAATQLSSSMEQVRSDPAAKLLPTSMEQLSLSPPKQQVQILLDERTRMKQETRAHAIMSPKPSDNQQEEEGKTS